MGKGDKKTKRGKIIAGSYGRKRPRKPWKDESNSSETGKKVGVAARQEKE